jgi:integrase
MSSRDSFRHLEEPFNLIALLCLSLGLRISECLALLWADVEWLGARLRIERGIVCQKVDTTKTAESRKQLSVDAGLLELLKTLAGRRGNSDCRPRKADAAFGYSHDAQRVRRRGHRRNGSSKLESG